MATRMETRSGLTQERVKETLRYCPDTGVWTWAVTLSARRTAGKPAGYLSDGGYRIVGIDGLEFRSHRLAWLYMTGEWPADQVDHINGDRSDNRWENLRPANNTQNQANTPVSANNKAGVKGVYWSKQKGKWQAKISPNGSQIHLGFFDNIADAAAAYEAAARRVFGDYARAA